MKRTPCVHIFILTAFLVNTFGPIPTAQAQEFRLPVPGVMVRLSPPLDPPILKGIKIHPDNPFRFDFILDKGDSELSNDQLKDESSKLIKYFLASLTIPEKDLWVNLSPYEKDRIIPQSFGLTEMGRDLLAEDYMLKQITASLIYPEEETGKKFWKRIYAEAEKKFGTTNIPINTFNKVWIVPQKAVVYENTKAGTAYVVKAKLKVMLEEDYLSLSRHSERSEESKSDVHSMASNIIRQVIIPELTKEVNEDKNFAQLRQVYNSLILATWYKKKIRDSILEQVYADKNKTAGVQYTSTVIPAKAGIQFKNDVEGLYQEYLKAFKKGVYNYIKEDQDPLTQDIIPRKYFSGGVFLGFTNVAAGAVLQSVHSFPSAAMIGTDEAMKVEVDVTPSDMDPAMKGVSPGADIFSNFIRRQNEEYARQKETPQYARATELMREVIHLALSEMGHPDLTEEVWTKTDLRLSKGDYRSSTQRISSNRAVIDWVVTNGIEVLGSEVGHAIHFALRKEYPHLGVAEVYDTLVNTLVQRLSNPNAQLSDEKDIALGRLLMGFIRNNTQWNWQNIPKGMSKEDEFPEFLRAFMDYIQLQIRKEGFKGPFDQNSLRHFMLNAMRDAHYGFNHFVGEYILYELYLLNGKDISATARQLYRALRSNTIDYSDPERFLQTTIEMDRQTVDNLFKRTSLAKLIFMASRKSRQKKQINSSKPWELPSKSELKWIDRVSVMDHLKQQDHEMDNITTQSAAGIVNDHIGRQFKDDQMVEFIERAYGNEKEKEYGDNEKIVNKIHFEVIEKKESATIKTHITMLRERLIWYLLPDEMSVALNSSLSAGLNNLSSDAAGDSAQLTLVKDRVMEADRWDWENAKIITTEELTRDGLEPTEENYKKNQTILRRKFLDLFRDIRQRAVDFNEFKSRIRAMSKVLLTGEDGKSIYVPPTVAQSRSSREAQERYISAIAGRFRNENETDDRLKLLYENLIELSNMQPDHGVSLNNIISPIIDFYIEFMGSEKVQSFIFVVGNHSLVMNIVNGMLRLYGLQGISQGDLDKQLRKNWDKLGDFKELFRDKIYEANPGIDFSNDSAQLVQTSTDAAMMGSSIRNETQIMNSIMEDLLKRKKGSWGVESFEVKFLPYDSGRVLDEKNEKLVKVSFFKSLHDKDPLFGVTFEVDLKNKMIKQYTRFAGHRNTSLPGTVKSMDLLTSMFWVMNEFFQQLTAKQNLKVFESPVPFFAAARRDVELTNFFSMHGVSINKSNLVNRITASGDIPYIENVQLTDDFWNSIKVFRDPEMPGDIKELLVHYKAIPGIKRVMRILATVSPKNGAGTRAELRHAFSLENKGYRIVALNLMISKNKNGFFEMDIIAEKNNEFFIVEVKNMLKRANLSKWIENSFTLKDTTMFSRLREFVNIIQDPQNPLDQELVADWGNQIGEQMIDGETAQRFIGYLRNLKTDQGPKPIDYILSFSFKADPGERESLEDSVRISEFLKHQSEQFGVHISFEFPERPAPEELSVDPNNLTETVGRLRLLLDQYNEFHADMQLIDGGTISEVVTSMIGRKKYAHLFFEDGRGIYIKDVQKIIIKGDADRAQLSRRSLLGGLLGLVVAAAVSGCAVTPDMKYTEYDIQKGRINYLTPENKGKPLLLVIHGANADPFEMVKGILEKFGKKYNILLYAYDDSRPLEKIASDLDDEVQKINAENGKPVNMRVIVHSYGAVVFRKAVLSADSQLFSGVSLIQLAPTSAGSAGAQALKNEIIRSIVSAVSNISIAQNPYGDIQKELYGPKGNELFNERIKSVHTIIVEGDPNSVANLDDAGVRQRYQYGIGSNVEVATRSSGVTHGSLPNSAIGFDYLGRVLGGIKDKAQSAIAQKRPALLSLPRVVMAAITLLMMGCAPQMPLSTQEPISSVIEHAKDGDKIIVGHFHPSSVITNDELKEILYFSLHSPEDAKKFREMIKRILNDPLNKAHIVINSRDINIIKVLVDQGHHVKVFNEFASFEDEQYREALSQMRDVLKKGGVSAQDTDAVERLFSGYLGLYWWMKDPYGKYAQWVTVVPGDNKELKDEVWHRIKIYLEDFGKLQEILGPNNELFRKTEKDMSPVLASANVDKDVAVVKDLIKELGEDGHPQWAQQLDRVLGDGLEINDLAITKRNIAMAETLKTAASSDAVNVFLVGYDHMEGLQSVVPGITTIPTVSPEETRRMIDMIRDGADHAMLATSRSNKGGIDLTPANMNLQVQNTGEEIKFHLDPAMLAQLQNAPGFVPVIINIQPLKNLQEFLGITSKVIGA